MVNESVDGWLIGGTSGPCITNVVKDCRTSALRNNKMTRKDREENCEIAATQSERNVGGSEVLEGKEWNELYEANPLDYHPHTGVQEEESQLLVYYKPAIDSKDWW